MAFRNGFMGSQAPGSCLHPMPAASNGLWQQGQDPTVSGRPWLGHLPTLTPQLRGPRARSDSGLLTSGTGFSLEEEARGGHR